MYNIFQRNAGVTLIEMLVVIAILGIMASVTIASFGSSREKRAVETSAREFSAVVRLAQNYALSGRQAPGINTCGYGISVLVSGTTYEIVPYQAVGSVCSDLGAARESYTVKPGVTMIPNNTGFSFSIPYGTVTGNTNFTFSKNGTRHYVCINAKGEIKDSPTSGCP